MVGYRVVDAKGVERLVERPGDFPDPHLIASVAEPMAHVSVMAPAHFLSPLLNALIARRGVQEDVVFINNGGAAGTDTSGTVPTVDRFYIGASATGTSQPCCWIEEITYYRFKPTSAQLATLSTL